MANHIKISSCERISSENDANLATPRAPPSNSPTFALTGGATVVEHLAKEVATLTHSSFAQGAKAANPIVEQEGNKLKHGTCELHMPTDLGTTC